MKTILLIFLIFFTALPMWSQFHERPEDRVEAAADTIYKSSVFVPHPRLLNTRLWKRVSEYRFECEYLRLAVEFNNHTYVLIEMDGDKRILARSIDYIIISNKIKELTLRNSPHFDTGQDIN